MTTNTDRSWIDECCKGNNPACVRGRIEGRPVHITPKWDKNKITTVLATYHFATADEAIAELERADVHAPLVSDDVQLEMYREMKIAYRLPVGWIDPERR